MCITNQAAELKKTKVLSFRLGNGNNFLAYSNSARNLSGGNNAMILPIPGELRREWFYDTTEYNDFMKDISSQASLSHGYELGIEVKSRSLSLSKSIFSLGQYTVLFTDDINEFDAALLDYGIKLTHGLYEFFPTHYGKCTYLACIFSANSTIDAQPIAFEYAPHDTSELFFPTMDSHNGKMPKASQRVRLDHHILTQVEGEFGTAINFTQQVPDFLMGVKFGGYNLSWDEDQGDFFTDASNTVEPKLKRRFALKQ